jgi:hypothetical protein
MENTQEQRAVSPYFLDIYRYITNLTCPMIPQLRSSEVVVLRCVHKVA